MKNTIYPDFLEEDDVYENLRKYGLREINEGSLPSIDTPVDAYDYSYYLIDVRTPKTNLRTGFLYNPDWGMDITARPSDNGVMRSVKQGGAEEFLSFLCLNVYHFTYDVVYPIEVLIRDDESFNGKGYVFRYAFPVMINHNAADRGGFLSKDFFMLGGDFIGECDDLEGPIYDIRVLGVDEYGIANMELKDANISYDCYKFKCDLGITTADEGAYRLRTQLPSSCAHGFIVAEKEDYLKSREQVLDSVDIDVDIKKLKDVKFEVVMNDYNSFSKIMGGDEKIESPFFAIINLQSVDVPSLSFYGRYPFEEDEIKTLSLIEQNSKYKLDMMLFDEADNVLIGGYQGEFTLGYDEIYEGKTIVFHAANYLPKPLNKEAEQNVFKFLDENNIYKDRLKPELR